MVLICKQELNTLPMKIVTSIIMSSSIFAELTSQSHKRKTCGVK